MIAVAGTNWHLGVIGIVASRLSERFSRPAVVISIVDGIGKGSGRSVEGIDLHTAIHTCAHHLRGYGGHKMAVGFSLDVDKIRPFTGALETVVARMRPMENQVEVDFKISPHDLTPELIKELDLLSPFGDGNPEPVFMMPAMEVLILGQAGRVFHTLGFTLKESVNHIPRYVDIAFTPVTRRLNGHTYLYLALKALSPG